MRKIFTRYSQYFKPQSLPDNAPAFMIVGAQKAGTTALYSFLSQHPGMRATEPKELHFFNCENRYALGIDFYHSLFPKTGRQSLTFDASPSYLFNPYSAERIFRYNGNMKIIVLLRDPIYRAFSAWNMYAGRYARNQNWYFEEWMGACKPVENGYAKRSEDTLLDFNKYILEEMEISRFPGNTLVEAPVIPHGYYSDQLSRYYAFFPKKQVLVIENSEFRKNTIPVLQNVEKFLGIGEYDWTKANLYPVFEGDYEPGRILGEDTLAMLSEHYAPYNRGLFRLIGKDYGWS